MKKPIAKFWLLTLSLGLLSGYSFANQDGTSTAQFLKIAKGARAEGMGGAFTAVADDARAVDWNPAGLAQITHNELTFDYLKYIEDMNASSIAGAVPLNKINGTLGFDATYVNMGTIDALDINENPISGDNKSSAYSGTLSYGQALGERIALGAGAKFIKQSLAGVSGSGAAVDLGVLVSAITDRLNLGVSVLNLGSKIKTGTVAEDIPRTIQGGLAFYPIPKELVLAADVVKENDADAGFRIGTEYIYQRMFAIRAGYQDTKESKGGFSAGAGYIWRASASPSAQSMGTSLSRANEAENTVRLDYAYVDYGDFNATHRLSLTFSF